MLFVRKTTKPVFEEPNKFARTYDDAASWKVDKLTQVIDVPAGQLEEGEYYISVFNWGRYVSKTNTGTKIKVEIVQPMASLLAGMESTCSCSGHGTCLYSASAGGTAKCACEAAY